METCTLNTAKIDEDLKYSYTFSRKIILLRMIKKIFAGSKSKNNQLTTI